jgi:hypothetical protein
MIRRYITVLLCLIGHYILGGPFAHFLNPSTKQANRIDFGTKSLQILIDGKHWVDAGPIAIDSSALTEIRKDADFKTIATGSSNQYTLFQECTNQIFNLDLTTRKISRLDRTYFRGDNCGSYNFIRKGKYYQIGGYGFWETNNHITFFDPKIKEWEGILASGDVPFGVYRSYSAYLPESDKLITFSNFSNDISQDKGSLKLNNDIYEFSFSSGTWTKIGKITHPYLTETLNKIAIDRRERVIFTGKYFVLFPIGTSGHVTITFIDPRNLKIYEYQDTEMKYSRFPFYNMSGANPHVFFYNEWLLGTINSNVPHLNNLSQLVNLHDIAKKAKFIGYLTDRPWYQSSWFYGLIGISCLGLFYLVFRLSKSDKKVVHLPVAPTQSIYFDDLQVTLLSHFYHHSTHEGLDVEQVNEILGITQLGSDTQRFRRSNAIKELNSKLALLTGEKNAILRSSSVIDKRQKRYQLHDNVKDFVKKELSL